MSLSRTQKATMLDQLDLHQSYLKGEIAAVHGYKPDTCLEPKHASPAHKAAWREGHATRLAKIAAAIAPVEQAEAA